MIFDSGPAFRVLGVFSPDGIVIHTDMCDNLTNILITKFLDPSEIYLTSEIDGSFMYKIQKIFYGQTTFDVFFG